MKRVNLGLFYVSLIDFVCMAVLHVHLSVGLVMETYIDHAAAASSQFCCKSKEELSIYLAIYYFAVHYL